MNMFNKDYINKKCFDYRLSQLYQKSLSTYPLGISIRGCKYCGLPLDYKSEDFWRGYHKDSCF